MEDTMNEPTKIKHRFTGAVLYSATVEGTTPSTRFGRTVRLAVKSGANLSGADLSDANLSDADLSGADLSAADLSGADLSGADLSGANLSDANLSGANLIGAYLRDANLSDANLSGADLRGTYLRGTYLRGANLSDANLSGAYLRGANLSDANLSGADFGETVPTIPGIHGAVYAAASQPKALDMGAWHTCGTTHCRAGWVTTLAGDAGAALEAKIGPAAAAAAIYLASDPERFKAERLPNFYARNEAALADMKRCSEEEAAR
jgi:hypothetical protein